jgi:hypothetical protein
LVEAVCNSVTITILFTATGIYSFTSRSSRAFVEAIGNAVTVTVGYTAMRIDAPALSSRTSISAIANAVSIGILHGANHAANDSANDHTCSTCIGIVIIDNHATTNSCEAAGRCTFPPIIIPGGFARSRSTGAQHHDNGD